MALLDNRRLDDLLYLLELANKAPKLFEKADYREKRNLITKLLSNLKLDGSLLGWKYKKPFDLMAFCRENSTWLAIKDLILNPHKYVDIINDFNTELAKSILEAQPGLRLQGKTSAF